jgi:hypothetical protein
MSRRSWQFEEQPAKRQKVQETVERFGMEFDELDPMLKAEVVFWSDPEDVKALCSISKSYSRFCRSQDMDAVWKQKIAALRGAPVRYNATLAEIAPGAKSWMDAWLRYSSVGPALRHVAEVIDRWPGMSKRVEGTRGADLPITRERLLNGFEQMFRWFAAHGEPEAALQALHTLDLTMLAPTNSWLKQMSTQGATWVVMVIYFDGPSGVTLANALAAEVGCTPAPTDCFIELQKGLWMAARPWDEKPRLALVFDVKYV